MFRFVILIWHSKIPELAPAAAAFGRRLIDLQSGWQSALQSDGMLVLCAGFGPGDIHRLCGESGLILGAVFGRNPDLDAIDPSPDPILDAAATDRIIASAGRHLISHYWGRYVAVLQDPRKQRRWILRDPSGELPCFVTSFRDITIFFSCLSDLTQVGLQFEINWRYVANRLIYGMGLDGQTGLSGVEEVYQGQCIEMSPIGRSRSSYWNPFSIAATDVIEDPLRAGRALHATLKSVTHTWTHRHRSILHLLSGGIDSSMILACLVDSPSRPNITCLTYRRREATEDLAYARLASGRAGCELLEETPEDCSPNFENFLNVNPAPFPLPGGIAWLWMSPCQSRLASEHQATAVTDGNPGDNMLGAIDHRYGALDYAQRHGLRCGLVLQAVQLAPWINTSVWTVLAQAVWGARRAYNTEPIAARCHPLRTLLSATALEMSARPPVRPSARPPVRPSARPPAASHPWYSGRLPAARATIMMADALSYPRRYYDAFCPPARPHPEPLEPLKSQPFMELCLRVPVYVLNLHGRSRGLIRSAFGKELPRDILNRHWKDRGGPAQTAVFLQNLDFARELLLHGALVAQGLLGRSSLERTLSATVAPGVGDVLEVCEAIIVESWMRTIPRVEARVAL